MKIVGQKDVSASRLDLRGLAARALSRFRRAGLIVGRQPQPRNARWRPIPMAGRNLARR